MCELVHTFFKPVKWMYVLKTIKQINFKIKESANAERQHSQIFIMLFNFILSWTYSLDV